VADRRALMVRSLPASLARQSAWLPARRGAPARRPIRVPQPRRRPGACPRERIMQAATVVKPCEGGDIGVERQLGDLLGVERGGEFARLTDECVECRQAGPRDTPASQRQDQRRQRGSRHLAQIQFASPDLSAWGGALRDPVGGATRRTRLTVARRLLTSLLGSDGSDDPPRPFAVTTPSGTRSLQSPARHARSQELREPNHADRQSAHP